MMMGIYSRLHVLSLAAGGGISELAAFDTADGVYDFAWSESHDSLLVAAIADGSVRLYEISLPVAANPIRSFHEHTREVQSADYNPFRRDSFLSSAWDDSIKLWTVDRLASVQTFKEPDLVPDDEPIREPRSFPMKMNQRRRRRTQIPTQKKPPNSKKMQPN